MAVAQSVLSETQRETLEALGDTFIPAIEADSHDPVEKEFMGRAASDMAVENSRPSGSIRSSISRPKAGSRLYDRQG